MKGRLVKQRRNEKMNEEHYLSKIERNTSVLDKVPTGELKDKYMQNILWARTLASKLEKLDYNERQVAIAKIHAVLEEDYKSMGFTTEEGLVEDSSLGM